MDKYIPSKIEPKWQRWWERVGLYRTMEPTAEKPKLYCLGMFPYPSGAGLHVGHVRIYTASDVLARFFRARGYTVLHPMGWDAFGLPAENDAIRNRQNPSDRVSGNIKNFKRQMKMLGLSYDWSREFATCDPSYYRWTQWLFLKLYEKGLVYQAEIPINWCPSCRTGLADEEAVGGKCDRCGAAVTKKDMKQWLLRITSYADRLLYDLDDSSLDWPPGIVKMQKDWIGRSEGVEINFAVLGSERETINVFTTRADTIFGVTALVLAPEHPIVAALLNSKLQVPDSRKEEVKKYVENSRRKSDLERTELAKQKSGVFTGCFAVNPINSEKIPVWVGDYVIGAYGGGAVMVVPAHDQRDYDFARRHNLEIRQVVKGGNVQESAYEGRGILINSGEFSGLESGKAIEAIADWLEKRGLGRRAVSYKMRDWVFSRQRYWGEPFPLIHCERCGVVPVPYEDLPVKLPYLKSYEPTGTGESPLAAVEEWVNVKCPRCGRPAGRETDTMPNWAGSCWYFLRFADPGNSKLPFSKDSMAKWLPVDWYLGGAEHAVLHLLYARFWVKVFYDLGLLSFKEPFVRLRGVGIVLAEDGRKMSKSWHNVVNPDDVVRDYGADALRLYEMFMGPWGQVIPWSTRGVAGCARFLNKVWDLVTEACSNEAREVVEADERIRLMHRTIKKVTKDIENFSFNTAIAALMEWVNRVKSGKSRIKNSCQGALSREEARTLLKLLSPFAPYITEELWQKINAFNQNDFEKEKSIHLVPWPQYDLKLATTKKVTIVVQVNGKLRDKMELERGSTKEEVEKLARHSARLKKYLERKEIKRVIFVPDKLVNFVTS